MSRPRLLDLFCGAGGAAMGYYRVGFDVTGVDIKPQNHYPFEFVQADALEYCAEHGKEFDAIHASPPCQAYSWAAARWQKEWPDLVEPTRLELMKTGKPFVIENVVGAPLLAPVVLCGTMFGLRVIRHRLFEMNPFMVVLVSPCAHLGSVSNDDFVTVAGHGGDGRASLSIWRDAMGIDWMDKQELTQAIPPAYTEFIGRQLLTMMS